MQNDKKKIVPWVKLGKLTTIMCLGHIMLAPFNYLYRDKFSYDIVDYMLWHSSKTLFLQYFQYIINYSLREFWEQLLSWHSTMKTWVSLKNSLDLYYKQK